MRTGLRTRVTIGFAAGALVVSAATALLAYDLTRNVLLTEREDSAVRSAYFDANAVRRGLAGNNPDVIDVLRSLDTGSTRRAVVRRDGRWYARGADAGVTASIPAGLQKMAASGGPGVQRVRTANGVVLVIGVPLPNDTQFYLIDSLAELDQTLKVLSLILTLVAAGTTAAGAAAGVYASRRVTRPLTLVADAARNIAAGDLGARLDTSADPDLERLTTSFNQMVDQLSAKLERDRRFAADVSHELRSPLQTLAAATSVLTRRRDHLDERTARAVDLVSDEVGRFETLVSDLLELARGDQPPETSPVDMAEMARRVCRRLHVSPAIVITDTEQTPVWRVDGRRFERVLTNLLDNAERHGGAPVALRLGDVDGRHYLEVDDDGPGVPPQDRHTIFDRFVRGRTANARGRADGTGLGLALVAQHVAAHGGRVEVTDRPGGGARFRVEVPRVSP